MVILVKIIKIGQLQMSVESREPTNDSGFFRLKHSLTIAKHKKLHIEGFLVVTRDAGPGRVHTIKIIFTQNRIENLVYIILGRFPIYKTQK